MYKANETKASVSGRLHHLVRKWRRIKKFSAWPSSDQNKIKIVLK